MRSYGISGFSDDEIAVAIKQKYGEGENADYVHQVAQIAGEFTQNPVLYQSSLDIKKAVADRRSYRRSLRDYVLRESKARVKATTFLGSWFLIAVLGGIVNWVVQKIMEKYFGEKSNEGD